MTEKVFQHIGIQYKSNTLPLVMVIKWAGSAMPITQLRLLSNNHGAVMSWLTYICIISKKCSISKAPHVLTITWAITATINIAHLFQRSINPEHINAFVPPWCKFTNTARVQIGLMTGDETHVHHFTSSNKHKQHFGDCWLHRRKKMVTDDNEWWQLQQPSFYSHGIKLMPNKSIRVPGNYVQK